MPLPPILQALSLCWGGSLIGVDLVSQAECKSKANLRHARRDSAGARAGLRIPATAAVAMPGSEIGYTYPYVSLYHVYIYM